MTTRIRDLKHRPVHQPQPPSVTFGLWTQRVLEPAWISRRLTQHTCRDLRLPKSKERIAAFAHHNRIDYRDIERCADAADEKACWSRFDSLNEFFTRRRRELPRVSRNTTRLHSPADAYVIYQSPTDVHRRVWIKGRQFSVPQLFGGTTASAHLPDYHLLIFRLAPHHYHRFHVPLAARVLALKVLGQEYFSVDPKIVNSRIDVYTRNVRMVLKLETPAGEWVYLAIVGATCVGSIVLTHPALLRAFGAQTGRTELNDAILRGQGTFTFRHPPTLRLHEELGYFQFGGSTLVLLAPVAYALLEAGDIVRTHSTREWETEVQVGDALLSCAKTKKNPPK